MLITAIITLVSVIAWAVTARALFRHWARNSRLEYWVMAVLAIGGVPFLPAIAFVGFVVRNPPLSQRELEAKTRELEIENELLQEQAGHTPHDCRDYDETPHCGEEEEGGPGLYYDAFDPHSRAAAIAHHQ